MICAYWCGFDEITSVYDIEVEDWIIRTCSCKNLHLHKFTHTHTNTWINTTMKATGSGYALLRLNLCCNVETFVCNFYVFMPHALYPFILIECLIVYLSYFICINKKGMMPSTYMHTYTHTCVECNALILSDTL